MKFNELSNIYKKIESQWDAKLPLQKPVIMRLDGKAFHTFTRSFEKPFSEAIHRAMTAAASILCKEIQCARFAYTQSDEISILIFEPTEKSQTWFGNRIQKMCSVAGSICSNAFNKQITAEISGIQSPLYDACFDVRILSVGPEDVQNYFIWRQEDAIRNSISMLAQAHFSHRKLHKKNRRDMLQMLQSKDIQWDELEDWKKYGSTVIRQWREKEGPNGEIVHRSYWGRLAKCPNFSEEDFVDEHLRQEIVNEVS